MSAFNQSNQNKQHTSIVHLILLNYSINYRRICLGNEEAAIWIVNIIPNDILKAMICVMVFSATFNNISVI
jgi:hypothetical protein